MDDKNTTNPGGVDDRSEDEDDNEFVEETSIGGWWQPEDEDAEPQPERRRHPRLPYSSTIEFVPPDGNEYTCVATNLSLVGILLQSDALRPAPPVGQLMELRLKAQGEVIVLSGEVSRHAEDSAFAVHFLHVDRDSRRQLALIIASCDEADQDEEPDTSYSINKER